jgi:hypothetical protein
LVEIERPYSEPKELELNSKSTTPWGWRRDEKIANKWEKRVEE